MLDDFIFCGRDIAEFGACAAFGENMTTGTEIDRMAYGLPGGGSVILGAPVKKAITRNVVIMPADGVTGDEKWVRRVTHFLMQGRGPLVLKHDPDVFRLAEFNAAPTYGAKIWPGGGLQMRMTLGPMAFAQGESRATGSTDGGEAALRLLMDTAERAPLHVTITCTSGTITAASLTANGQTLSLEGMSLLAGESVSVRCADMLLGELAEVRMGEAMRFELVSAWAQLEAGNGEEIRVRVTGGEASIRISARARYYA